MTIKGTTHHDSLVQRLERYYRSNPFEMLTWKDVAAKFDCTEQQVRKAVEYIQKRRERIKLEVVGVVRVKES